MLLRITVALALIGASSARFGQYYGNGGFGQGGNGRRFQGERGGGGRSGEFGQCGGYHLPPGLSFLANATCQSRREFFSIMFNDTATKAEIMSGLNAWAANQTANITAGFNAAEANFTTRLANLQLALTNATSNLSLAVQVATATINSLISNQSITPKQEVRAIFVVVANLTQDDRCAFLKAIIPVLRQFGNRQSRGGQFGRALLRGCFGGGQGSGGGQGVATGQSVGGGTGFGGLFSGPSSSLQAGFGSSQGPFGSSLGGFINGFNSNNQGVSGFQSAGSAFSSNRRPF